MKKFLLALLATASVIPALAAPEALYLVGSMNNWNLPGYAPDSDIYELKKTGESYTGTFDVPAGFLEFKLFTSKASQWDDTAYGMASSTQINVFKDKSATVELVNDEITYFTSNVYVSNWMGGEVTVACTLNETDHTVSMTISGAGQPAMPEMPSVYVIGEFNDWQLPTATELNGAVSLDMTYETEPNYIMEFSSTRFPIPAGKAKYVYYYKNTVTGEDTFIGGPGSAFSIFDNGIQASKIVHQRVMDSQLHSGPISARHHPFEIVNYTGDDLFFQCGIYMASCEPYTTTVGWNDAPVNEMPALNVLIGGNGHESLFLTSADSPTVRSWSGKIIGPFDLSFTTAHTPGDADAIRWGVEEPFNMTVRDSHQAHLVSGGGAIHVDGNSSGTPVTVSIDYNTHTVTVTTSGFDASLIEKVWVIGYMSGWPSPTTANEDKFPCLTAVEPGVFEGIVDCPAADGGDPEFRFKTELNGWVAEGCLGSGEADFSYREVFFTDNVYSTYIVRDGLGNWRLPDWTTSGQVKMRVDLNNMELTLTDMSSSAIEEVADGSLLPERYFNLQGQPVENPGRGLYIRVRGDKSEKVIY